MDENNAEQTKELESKDSDLNVDIQEEIDDKDLNEDFFEKCEFLTLRKVS